MIGSIQSMNPKSKFHFLKTLEVPCWKAPAPRTPASMTLHPNPRPALGQVAWRWAMGALVMGIIQAGGHPALASAGNGDDTGAIASTRMTHPLRLDNPLLAENMTSLEGSQWWLTSYRTATGEMATAQSYGVEGPSVQFSEGGMGGNATCNRFFGSYEQDGDTLTIQPGGSTMMACPPEFMTQEQAFLTALGQVVRYEITNSTLQLFDAEGHVVLTFSQQTSPTITGTLWQLIAYNNGREAVTSIIAGTHITVTFDANGGLTGFAGCNNYMANYTLTQGTLSIGPGVSTRKFCAQPEGLMAQETAYLQALETTAAYTITGNTLTLKTASGATVAQFRAAD